MTERHIIDGHRHVLVRADDLLWAVNTLKVENRYSTSEIVRRLDAALPHDEGAFHWNDPADDALPPFAPDLSLVEYIESDERPGG